MKFYVKYYKTVPPKTVEPPKKLNIIIVFRYFVPPQPLYSAVEQTPVICRNKTPLPTLQRGGRDLRPLHAGRKLIRDLFAEFISFLYRGRCIYVYIFVFSLFCGQIPGVAEFGRC